MKIYHTKTQEDYDALMKELELRGILWIAGGKPTNINIWEVCKEDTCVICDNKTLSHCSVIGKNNAYPNITTIEYTAQKNNYKGGEYRRLPKEEIAKRIKDAVDSPKHYTQGERETIENIRDAMNSEGYQGYCVGNVIKYLARYKFKNGLEDVRKAKKYIEFLEEELMKQEG